MDQIVDDILERHVVVDFETYFKSINGDPEKYSLSDMTTPEYIHDPRFKIHGVAIQHSGQKAEFFPSSDAGLLRTFLLSNGVDGKPVIMHNAYFDDYIMCNLLGLVAPRIVDTQGLSLAILGNRKETGQSTGLKALALRLGIRPKGDLTYLNGKRDLSPAQMDELAEYARGDAEITGGVLRMLLPLLTRPGQELAYQQHTIRLFTAPDAGVGVDRAALEALRDRGKKEFQAIFDLAKVTEEDVSKDKTFANLMATALFRTGRTLPTKQGKHGLIPALAKTDPAMQALLDDGDPAVAALAEARLAKKSLDQFESRLLSIEAITRLTGGRLPLYLQYHGSHTGRVSGGDGLNQLNMGRDGLQGDIRGLYLPRPGNVFIIGDASQIEARIVAWLAGQDDLVEEFRAGADVYVSFAQRLFCKTEISKKERALGKVCILGLGFGMGVGTLLTTVQKNPDLAPMLEAGELSLAQIRDMHELYRETFPLIPKLWQVMQDDMEDLIRTGCPFGRKVLLGWDDLCGRSSAFIMLPSGRKIQYPDLRLEHQASRSLVTIGKDGKLRGASVGGRDGLSYGVSGYLYGGKIVENIVQAIARDILYAAIMHLDGLGHRVVFHVFDEIILEVPKGMAERAKLDLEHALSRTPDWAPGLPLAAEAIVAERYCKA